MDKGGGLTIDSDPPIGFFVPKPTAINPFLKPKWINNNNNNNSSMDDAPTTNNNNHRFSGIEFSVSPTDNRVTVDEVDFFSSKTSSTVDVKKENSSSHGGAAPRFDLDVNTGLHLLTANTASDQSTVDDGVSTNAEDKRSKNQMAVIQAELDRVNEENQRLRGMLSQITSSYSSLQMHLAILQQQQQNRKPESTQDHDMLLDGKLEEKKHESNAGGFLVPRQFIEMGPGATAETDEPSQSSSEGHSGDRSGSPRNSLDVKNSSNSEIIPFEQQDKSEFREGRRSVGREESPDEASQGWAPNKVPKLSAAKNVDQSSAEAATMRKVRVSVRARSEAPMITDGCQWRKYGQKMAKGNPCPRAYYRCTMAAGCPVRKQVQRCAEDRTILITTYEGTHNHPLPPAAMTMASTTSAAASMLLSGSMSSTDGLMNSNFLSRALLPSSSSMATISASAPFPTVTLDLTHSPNPLQFQRPQTQFHVPFPGGGPAAAAAGAAPQNFGGAAPPQLAQVFGQNLYASQSKFSGLQMPQNGENAQFAQQHHTPQPTQQTVPPSLADTVSAATAAITADPSFTAALVAAISSIMGGAHQPNNNSNNDNNNNTTTSNNSGNSNSNKIPNSNFASH